ncbi:DUF2726 domain-containing protein [Vallitalea sp.]|jgi:hypothetical protein|uniref:DUF2726 domain-containing protein n=1 Tax=Vallitalea sp. TaxID=1882829 RepID=UPI0025D27D04|nr:DUF2726 domain-containing protein [Vallitalea sp.]MCT4686851.1 DUF2726 domain-containing protein [Vallitalea sp.]
MYTLILVSVIFVVIIIIKSLSSNNESTNNNTPTDNPTNESKKTTNSKNDYSNAYYGVNSLLSKAEFSFYKILYNICLELDVTLFTKVRVADIIKVGKIENRQTYFNKIKSKHVDFVLCNTQTLKPIICIELDDKSHNNNDRNNRDKFMDEIIGIAGFKSLHIKCSYSYNRQLLKEKIQNELNS